VCRKLFVLFHALALDSGNIQNRRRASFRALVIAPGVHQ
jgi:hypothetical protein